MIRKIRISILKQVLIVFILAFSMQSKAQGDYEEISHSMPYKVVDSWQKHYLVKGNEILTMKISGKRIVMQKLDAESMSLKTRKEYKDFPRGFSYESIQKLGDKYYLFFSVWDKPNKNEQLFYREIDFENTSFYGKEELIIKVKGKIVGSPIGSIGGLWSFGTADKFFINTSFKGSKVLINYRKRPTERRDSKNHDVIGFFVFNNKLERIWGDEIRLPYTEKKMDNLDYSIDEKGNVFLLSLVFNDDTRRLYNRKTKEINYHIELMQFEEESAEVRTTPINIKNKNLDKIWLFEHANGGMVCAGFYTNNRKNETVDGIITFDIDEEGSPSETKIYEIPVEILNQYAGKRASRKNKKRDKKGRAEFAYLELQQMIEDEAGNILLIGEQNYVEIRYTTDSKGRTQETRIYHYNDILVTKIDNSGELMWMKKLPKRQKGGRPLGGMSYKYMTLSGKHYFFYLDNVKNKELPINEVPKKHIDGKGGFLTAYVLDPQTGSVQKKSIINFKDFKGMKLYQFKTNRIFKLNEKEVGLELYKKRKEDILIKIKMEK